MPRTVEMTASHTIIRAYEPGDEFGILDLFGRCFGRSLSLAHWQWKMQSFVHEYDNIWVAESGQKIVGHYSGVPFEAWIDGQRDKAIVSVDAMVHPEMRRRGILTRMVGSAHEAWRQAGVRFTLGLPNEQWGSRTAAVGWIYLAPLRWLVRVLRPERIIARRTGLKSIAQVQSIGAISRRLVRRASADPGIKVEEITAPHPGLDAIGGSDAVVRQRLQRCRGSDWVERRYLACPDGVYRVLLAKRGAIPLGYAVYRLHGLAAIRATIAEVVAVDEETFAALVSEIDRRCLQSGVELIRALAVHGTKNYRRFRHCGFVPRKAAFALHYIPFDLEMQDIGCAGKWQIEGGDFDVV